MKGLERQIRNLLDKTAILEVLSNYAIAVDSGDAAGFADLFAPNAVWEWPQIGLTYEGRPAMREMATAIAEHLPGGQHMISNHVIDIEGDCATAVCQLICFISRPRKIYTVLQGHYRDQLIKLDGRWLISHRTVEVRNPEILSRGEIGELYRDLISALSAGR